MAGDRRLILFRRALARRAIDPARFDGLDANCLIDAASVVDEMERQDLTMAFAADVQYHASCVGSTDIKFGNEHMKLATEARSGLFDLLFPWQGNGKQGVAKTLTAAWERLHGGSVNDARIKSLIMETVSAMDRRAAEGQKQAVALVRKYTRRKKV